MVLRLFVDMLVYSRQQLLRFCQSELTLEEPHHWSLLTKVFPQVCLLKVGATEKNFAKPFRAFPRSVALEIRFRKGNGNYFILSLVYIICAYFLSAMGILPPGVHLSSVGL